MSAIQTKLGEERNDELETNLVHAVTRVWSKVCACITKYECISLQKYAYTESTWPTQSQKRDGLSSFVERIKRETGCDLRRTGARFGAWLLCRYISHACLREYGQARVQGTFSAAFSSAESISSISSISGKSWTSVTAMASTFVRQILL